MLDCGDHADVGAHAGDQQVRDAQSPQDEVQVRPEERVVTALALDPDVARLRLQSFDHLRTIGSLQAMRRLEVRLDPVVGHLRPVHLLRVDHRESLPASLPRQRSDDRDHGEPVWRR